MAVNIEQVVRHFRDAEIRLHSAIKERASALNYTIVDKRVRFDKAVRQRHKALREGLISFIAHSGIMAVLGAPFIYAMIVPLILLDIALTIYQFATSLFYGIQKEHRADYITIDRQYLAYLNAFQKFNCVYCGYANGLLAWGRAIAGRTEEHFCPIKHARKTRGQHDLYWDFADYGDAQTWMQQRDKRRKKD